jgi:hypothetical protein
MGLSHVPADEVAAWVEASCIAQGVSGRSADLVMIARVVILLRGGRDGDGARQAKRGPVTARRRNSGAPDRDYTIVVEPIGLALCRVDDDVLDDGGDDGRLAG